MQYLKPGKETLPDLKIDEQVARLMVYYKGALSYETLQSFSVWQIDKYARYAKLMNDELKRAMRS